MFKEKKNVCISVQIIFIYYKALSLKFNNNVTVMCKNAMCIVYILFTGCHAHENPVS